MARPDIGGKIEALLSDYLQERELEIYKTEYKKEGPDWKLRVFIDKTENAESEYVSISECEDVTRYLSDRLDEDDPIDRAYTLEVSSPGLDRELFRDKDFVRYAGREVEVRLYEAIDGSKMLTGKLVGADGDAVRIDIDDSELSIPGNKVSRINLAVVF